MKKNQTKREEVVNVVTEVIIEEGTSSGQQMRIIKGFSVFPGVNSITNYDIPVGGQVISITGNHDNAKMWVLCDPTAPTEKRTFRAYPCNSEIYFKGTTSLRYVGTTRSSAEEILHVFEVI